MQNKGAIKLIAILLAIICLYQLSFTFVTRRIEKKAKEYAQGDYRKEYLYLDSLSGKVVYNLGIRKYTYKECKERELNLGLDLKGGMNVVLEISMADIVKALSNYNPDSTFNKALQLAKQKEKTSTKDFITLFGEAFQQLDPNGRLSAIFSTMELRDKINYETSNEEVIKILKKEADAAFNNSFNVLRSRIDRFGVTQPNIQKLENTSRILIELPGIKEPERVRKLLQGTASLEFWETYENAEIAPLFEEVNKIVKDYLARCDSAMAENEKKAADTIANEKTEARDTSASALLKLVESDTAARKKDQKTAAFEKDYPFYAVLQPYYDPKTGRYIPGSVVGIAHYKDTAKVNFYLNLPKVKSILPKDVKFIWSIKPPKYDRSKTTYELHAIKVTTRDGRAPLDGSVITSANKSTSQTKGGWEVEMSMNADGASKWARMTRENAPKAPGEMGRCIAIVLDNYVYSAPRVQTEIKGGNSQITGDFTPEEADDLANVLKSGKLPAPARIVQEAIVGPSLGAKSIHDGMISFLIAFLLVLLYMWFYYSKAGLTANVALFSNVFLIFGTLASFGAVLTLPGIAGIVLTLGMAVDANVLIYERIREELRGGKMMKAAVDDGYKHAMPAIIDSNLTTIITGVALYWFGTGPIQGFATTLIIGILTSLFTAIFISRIIMEWLLKRGKEIKLGNRFTMNFLTNTKIDFIGIRKYFYILSGILILISVVSFFVNGFNLGLDFKGGHNYIIRFERKVNTIEAQKNLSRLFEGNTPEVKVYGSENQIKIATKYLIDDDRPSSMVDSILECRLYEGLKTYLPDTTSLQTFRSINILSAEKVGPTVADDIKWAAVEAVFFALLGIFLYIFFRFKGWRYGLGGVTSLFHDTIIVLGAYSLFYKVMPFSLEIDQSFIAAILTVIGYSINDTVIIYDRIREYTHNHPKWTPKDIFNGAFNSTLSRTINTSMTTLLVLIAIFTFGGEVIRGFIFAMLLGIGVGTYSSIFNAAAIVYDLLPRKEKEEKK